MIQSSNPLNASELIFPALECIHIIGFAVTVGSVAILDFRLLGLGLRRQSVEELARNLVPWTLVGLAIMLLSGPAMFSSDPDMYYLNSSFQVKMILLLLAIVFHYTFHSRATLKGAYPRQIRLIACISLVLWMGVVAGGIFIAFVGDAIPQ